MKIPLDVKILNESVYLEHPKIPKNKTKRFFDFGIFCTENCKKS
ncbi:MAG: hypothetical protein Q7S74_03015 [Nanoarchaeota archaeon]|nr:hypothetical protein [Nanoarchaeota archaeon]